jgi:hypothetical protein
VIRKKERKKESKGKGCPWLPLKLSKKVLGTPVFWCDLSGRSSGTCSSLLSSFLSQKNIVLRLLKLWTCVFSICVFIYPFHLPRPKQCSNATVNYNRVYPPLLDQSTGHDSAAPRWCRGVIWTLSSSSPSIRSHSSRRLRTLRRGVQPRRLCSWLVLASIPPETISNCARRELAEDTKWGERRGEESIRVVG